MPQIAPWGRQQDEARAARATMYQARRSGHRRAPPKGQPFQADIAADVFQPAASRTLNSMLVWKRFVLWVSGPQISTQ